MGVREREREKQVPWSFAEARCAQSDAKVPLEGGQGRQAGWWC